MAGKHNATPQGAASPGLLGSYRVGRRIASGAMGAVFEAEQENPKRRVAIKILHIHRLTTDLIQRMERESEILGRLQHPGIAQVYDAGYTDVRGVRQPYFTMEYIQGDALTSYCESMRLSTGQRLELLAQVADAVQYAHEKGVIHRDLKPGNILVNQHGRPKILDFGVARLTADADSLAATITEAGQVVGTLTYMSPEQLDGSSRATARSDVYALGAIAVELLTGRALFDLSGMSIVESMRYIRENNPAYPQSSKNALNRDVLTIIKTAVQRDPRDRYDSAAAFAADIRRYLAYEPILARSASPAYVGRKFVRRHRALVGVVATVMIVLLGGLTSTTLATIRSREALSELEQVARFQEQQLAIEPSAVGRRMRETLRHMHDSSFEYSGLDDQEVQRRIDRFAGVVENIDFTQVATRTVAQNILEPSLKAIAEQFADLPEVRAMLMRRIALTMERIGGDQNRVAAIRARADEIARQVVSDQP